MEWMGTGVYFWEHAPRQAWQWARDVRKEASPAVVGALRRLGRCFDLLDPLNVATLQSFHTDMAAGLSVQKNAALRNTRRHKKRDCAVFNHLYEVAEAEKQPIDSVRGVFVPAGQTRAWTGSWVHEEAHIQICVRNPKAVIAVWHVRENGSYGLPAVDEQG